MYFSSPLHDFMYHIKPFSEYPPIAEGPVKVKLKGFQRPAPQIVLHREYAAADHSSAGIPQLPGLSAEIYSTITNSNWQAKSEQLFSISKENQAGLVPLSRLKRQDKI